MVSTIRIHVDEATRHEIDELAKSGKASNAAIVDAIHAAYRNAMHEQMRRVSLELRDDPVDRAEVRAAREAIGAEDAW